MYIYPNMLGVCFFVLDWSTAETLKYNKIHAIMLSDHIDSFLALNACLKARKLGFSNLDADLDSSQRDLLRREYMGCRQVA